MWGLQEQGEQLGAAVTLEGRTSQGKVWSPRAARDPGVRVEVPKCLSVLQARYEICVMCFVSSECLL